MISVTSPKAIFIDLDGVLADSLSVMRVSYQRFLKQFQVQGTDEEFSLLNGPPLAEVVRRLKAVHGLVDDVDMLLANYFEIIDQAYTDVVPSPGAQELLSKAKVYGCLVGVVTSNSTIRTQSWLKAVNLAHLIEFIVSGDDVKSGKPNPEPYLLAATRVACPPANIIAIEDSLQGAQSAVGAGLMTFLITKLDESDVWPPGIVPIRSLHQLIELFD